MRVMGARSVAASYKPPMLVTRARLPACASQPWTGAWLVAPYNVRARVRARVGASACARRRSGAGRGGAGGAPVCLSVCRSVSRRFGVLPRPPSFPKAPSFSELPQKSQGGQAAARGASPGGASWRKGHPSPLPPAAPRRPPPPSPLPFRLALRIARGKDSDQKARRMALVTMLAQDHCSSDILSSMLLSVFAHALQGLLQVHRRHDHGLP